MECLLANGSWFVYPVNRKTSDKQIVASVSNKYPFGFAFFIAYACVCVYLYFYFNPLMCHIDVVVVVLNTVSSCNLYARSDVCVLSCDNFLFKISIDDFNPLKSL